MKVAAAAGWSHRSADIWRGTAAKHFLCKGTVHQRKGERRSSEAEQGGSLRAHDAPPIAAVPFVLLGRGDEADDLVFLQLLHDAGELTLRNAGHSDADFIEPASHRSGRD